MHMPKASNTLTKQHVLDFLKGERQMCLATFGSFPWIATVYYTFDDNLHLYFMSDQSTLHCQQIAQNSKVAIAIANSNQNINKPKRGLQISGIAEQLSSVEKVTQALKMWKQYLHVRDPGLTYKAVKNSMYRITPKRIKLFDQELFKKEDGKEPVMELE